MQTPLASVIMPVYNAVPYLKEAIDSILHQTFTEFEFLIFDDGSTDGSWELLQGIRDNRIRLFRSTRNLGYIKHLNRGINLAKGKYLIRMDADDIALSQRFERQIAFMETHPEIGIAGTAYESFGQEHSLVRFSSKHDKIIVDLLFYTAIHHPCFILRRSAVLDHQLYYDNAYLYAEDYELLIRASQKVRLANLKEVLLKYRVHAKNVSSIHATRQTQIVDSLRVGQMERLLKRKLSPPEKQWLTVKMDWSGKLDFQQLKNLFHAVSQVIKKDPQFNAPYLDKKMEHWILNNWQIYHNKTQTKWDWGFIKNSIHFFFHFPGLFFTPVIRIKRIVQRRLKSRWLG